MADLNTYGILPGIGSTLTTTESQIWWGRETDLLWENQRIIGSTATDAGNTPSTTIRAGMLLGKVTSSGKLLQWDATATDGTQYVWGVLNMDTDMLDASGVAADHQTPIIRRGPLMAGALFIKGVALVGHADEHLARRQLLGNGCIFDDDVPSRATSLGGALANVTIPGAAHSPTSADNGSRFNYTQAGTVTVTLPTIQAGLIFEFLQTVAQTMVVQSAAGTDIIDLGALNASSITFSTGGKEIGALVRFEAIYEGATPTLKWLMTIPTTANGTGVTGGVAYAIG